MTKRIEVTDEMVDRGIRGFESVRTYGDEAMRAALEAALNPPEEREIPVSEKMLKAGMSAVEKAAWTECSTDKLNAEVYRAMERVRREEQEPLKERRKHDRRGAAQRI